VDCQSAPQLRPQAGKSIGRTKKIALIHQTLLNRPRYFSKTRTYFLRFLPIFIKAHIL
jgi:hypothetical protein